MKRNIKSICAVMVMTLFVMLVAPASYAEAAKEPYLAYETTEYGTAVFKLKNEWEKEEYRVEKLLMSPGESVDLCFIVAGSWKNPEWTSSDVSVATIDGNGIVTAKNPGVTEITLTYKKFLSNKKITVKTKAYVGESTWEIGIGTNSDVTMIDCYRMKTGTKVDLNVYGIPEINSLNYQVQWTSSNKNVAEMFANTLHAKKTGNAKVGVKIINLSTGKVIEKSVDVEVTKPVSTVLEDWDNKYYKLYGENYKRMFSSGAFALSSSEIEEDMLDEAYKVCNDAMGKIGFSAIKELFDLSSSSSMAFESVFMGKSRTEEERLGAIQYLISEMTEDSINEKYVEVVSDALKKTNSVLDSMNDIHDIDEAVLKIEQAGEILEKAEIKSLTKYIKEDAAGDIGKVMSEGVTISEYMITAICLYEADTKFLDELQRCSKPGESLYDDIELLKQERKKEPVQFFKQKYIGDVAGRVLCKAILKLAGKELTAVYDAANMAISIGMDMAGVPSLSDTVKAQYLMEYIIFLRGNIWGTRNEIMNNFNMYSNEQLKHEIEKYELMYNTYLAMVEPVCNAVYELLPTGEWNQELLDDRDIPLSGYDYDRHVAEAMNLYLYANPSANEREQVKEIESVNNTEVAVQKKIDLLFDKLGVKEGTTTYFTVNQKECSSTRYSGHGCTNCNVGDIIQASWFKEKFGTINASLFPYHDVNASRRDHAGQSCFGFACFAQWYLYANSNADKVTAERVATVTYNKADLQANVQPGDVLRVNGHSVLVYAVEEKGLRVIDSNWNMGNQLNCVVQKHVIPYEKSWCSGHTVYVNRVTDEKETESGTSIEDSAIGQKGYLDLKTVGWSSYNVGTNVEMYADKAYTIYHGSKLEVLGVYIDSKGNKIYHVYSESLGMKCYVSAKYVMLGNEPTATPKPATTPKPTVTPKPTATPKPAAISKPTAAPQPTATPKPTASPSPTATKVPTKTYGYLDLYSQGWSSYNVGTDVEMNASKAYTIYHGSRFEILGKYTNSKGNEIYYVYSESLGMKCYVSARVVVLGEAPEKTYGTLDLSSKGWKSYNVGLDKELYADKKYTIYNGAQLEILGLYTNSKGNKIYQVYSSDLKMECYVSASYVKINK